MLEDSPNADALRENLFTHSGYAEFTLPKVDEDNVTNIENSLAKGMINRDNKYDMLVYLEKLLERIQIIRKQETTYEGHVNPNMDEYITRLSLLISGISKI